MARTAKTNHVMSLVGEKSKKTAPAKDRVKPQKEEEASLKPINPALLPIEEELRFAQRRYSDPTATTYLHTSSALKGEQTDTAAAHNSTDSREQTDMTAARDYSEKSEKTDQAPPDEKNSGEAPEYVKGAAAEKGNEAAVEKGKEGITAVVPELINQELDAIVKRFHITPSDNNLWQLTKAVLESVRPEFSLNEEDYREKCGRLRQKVILEMTKAAIKVSKNNRK